MNNAYKNVAHNLRVRRTAHEMTQADLSDESGVPRTTISKIETCCCKVLTIETLIKLASALGVDLQYFLPTRYNDALQFLTKKGEPEYD